MVDVSTGHSAQKGSMGLVLDPRLATSWDVLMACFCKALQLTHVFICVSGIQPTQCERKPRAYRCAASHQYVCPIKLP